MAVRKIIKIDEELCTGCGNCVVDCEEGALEIIDGKAKVIKDSFCDGLGACIGNCPTGALTIIEREADEFDEEAVEEHLQKAQSNTGPPVCGCPSAVPEEIRRESSQDTPAATLESRLQTWPVQIHLVPPTAPFLQGADLTVIADCVAYSYAMTHEHFMKDKVVMIGCPKFDDKEAYVQKFSDIFKSNEIKSLTLVHMQVPCCFSFKYILDEAMKRSGKAMGYKEVIVTIKGEIKT